MKKQYISPKLTLIPIDKKASLNLQSVVYHETGTPDGEPNQWEMQASAPSIWDSNPINNQLMQ